MMGAAPNSSPFHRPKELDDPSRSYVIVRVNAGPCRLFDPTGSFVGVYDLEECLDRINRRETAIPSAAREVWLHEVET